MKNKRLRFFILLTFALFSVNMSAQSNYVDLVYASEKSVPAVVHIKSEFVSKGNSFDYYFPWLFGIDVRGAAPVIATGSGVIVSEDGYIVTNNHVVEDAISVEITLNDKRAYKANIIGTDPSSDLALLKIEENNLPYLEYADSDQTKVGEWVLAVGNPMNLTSTVTAGIVSAKARNINIIEGNRDGYAVESFIQTDAAVNMGNSGGALVNERGDLVGINTAIESGTGYYSGYSFAIPSNIVKKIISDLKDYGEVQRAVLGVQLREITSEFARQNNLKVLNGAYVAAVGYKSNAEKAGIKVGDVITRVNDKQIHTTSELIEKISQFRPGDDIIIYVNRNGKDEVLYATLSSKDDRQHSSNEYAADGSTLNSILGAYLSVPSEKELSEYNVTSGLLVNKVVEGGIFSNAGIKEGFMITKIDRVTITDIEQLSELLNYRTGGVLVEGKYSNGMKAYYGFGL